MLYLEDYLEMIEHLPSELRDRFTAMRETDLSVQNRVDSLLGRQRAFFSECSSKKLSSKKQEEEYNRIRNEYERIVSESSDKIAIAEDCYTLVDKYLRKLDVELEKFKLELEADNRGITELLEKRSLEMDNNSANNGGSNGSIMGFGDGGGGQLQGQQPQQQQQQLNMAKENRLPRKHRKQQQSTSASHSRPLDSQSSGDAGNAQSSSTSSGTYSLQHIGAGGNAIAAAASQAIAATQQLVPGRRTSSLKASYEAIHLGLQTHEFSIGKELAGAASSALAAMAEQQAGPRPAKKQKTSRRQDSLLDPSRSSATSEDMKSANNDTFSSGLSSVNSSGSLLTNDILGEGVDEPDWAYDPHEPRYCVCNQVSYGDMVACDNEDCPYEWFHYPCVGVTAPPKGKWYCPTCSARRKAEGRRK